MTHANAKPEVQVGDGPLNLGDGLHLPLEAVTETFAILAKRGAGKTTAAAVLTEELVSAGQQVIVVDPVGVWWGLRSHADGVRPGLPVVIIGGDHADVELDETAGAHLARTLVDGRWSAVLDLSRLSKAGTRRFMAPFLEELYRHNRDPLLLVVDEADLLAPQRTAAEGARVLGAMEDVVRRGRAHGIGAVLISQRPAVLHKDVLGQAEVLMTLRMTSPRDVAAIDEWVRLHADDEDARELKASLPSLPTGTAWVWSPSWLGILRRTALRNRWTFDSSATPKPGQTRPSAARATAAALDPADLQRLREQLTPSATDGASHPVPVTSRHRKASTGQLLADNAVVDELRATVAHLTDRLRAAQTPTTVEVPVLDDVARAELTATVAQLELTCQALQQTAALIAGALTPATPGFAAHRAAAPHQRPQPAAAAATTPSARVRHVTSTPTAPALAAGATAGEGPTLRKGARHMLEVLASCHPLALTRAQLATLAGIAVRGGTFANYYSTLRREGLITEHDKLTSLTAQGLAALSREGARQPVTTEEIREQWRAALRAGAVRMLDALIAAHPHAVRRSDLAAAAGIEPTGGTFGNYLSQLRRNGLADVAGDSVTANDVLFLTA